jgi:trk system potassium uptake protein TrkH
MRLLLVVGVIAQLVSLFSAAFAAPAILALWDSNWEEFAFFAGPMVGAFVFGRLARRAPEVNGVIHRGEALAVVAGTWLVISALGAVPYALLGLTVVDAVFESMSGFTTTGATVITNFKEHGRAFYLWRAMTQWFGGLGVIALFVVVLPRLGIAGRQLFFAEATRAPAEAVSPSAQLSARRLWILYTALTVVLILLLHWVGMDPYDAVVHALTTLSSGGFSPHADSIAAFQNDLVEWILSLFMIVAGTSFTLLYKVFSGRPTALLKDGEFHFYVGVVAVTTVAVAFTLADDVPDLDDVRLSLFQVASLISSTGYASADFNLWADSARGLLVLVMVIGGCAASSCGGPKVIRWVLVIKHILREITRVLHPRAIIPVRYKGQPIADDIMRSVFMLVVLYLAGHFLLGIALILRGADLVVGFSAALACLGNIGPGFGVVGPMGSFAGFDDVSKVLLIIGMWIGRLEIVTVLALLHPDVWRKLRLR